MKKLVILVVLMALFCIPAYASGLDCSSPLGGAILNSCVQHPPDRDTIFDREDPIGIGVNFVAWQDDNNEIPVIDEVTIEPRWDFANDETSLFFIARANIWQEAKKLFQKVE